jgi:hypothetical protein
MMVMMVICDSSSLPRCTFLNGWHPGVIRTQVGILEHMLLADCRYGQGTDASLSLAEQWARKACGLRNNAAGSGYPGRNIAKCCLHLLYESVAMVVHGACAAAADQVEPSLGPSQQQPRKECCCLSCCVVCSFPLHTSSMDVDCEHTGE